MNVNNPPNPGFSPLQNPLLLPYQAIPRYHAIIYPYQTLVYNNNIADIPNANLNPQIQEANNSKSGTNNINNSNYINDMNQINQNINKFNNMKNDKVDGLETYEKFNNIKHRVTINNSNLNLTSNPTPNILNHISSPFSQNYRVFTASQSNPDISLTYQTFQNSPLNGSNNNNNNQHLNSALQLNLNLQPFGSNISQNLNFQNPNLVKTNTNSNSKESKNSDDLRASIQVFVKSFESSPKNTQAISSLSSRFAIKRRRLYDVINVFEAIGCCERSDLDAVRWIGKENIITNLNSLRKQRGIDDSTKMLEDLFPVPCCVGISNLTISFLLLFFALKQDRIDLRYVSHFFSRNTARYKTTLCKLYQICYILGSIGVTERTSQVCEVILNRPYFSGESLPDDDLIFVPTQSRSTSKTSTTTTPPPTKASDVKSDTNCDIKNANESSNENRNDNVYKSHGPLSISSLLNRQNDDINETSGNKTKIEESNEIKGEENYDYVFERRDEIKRCYAECSKKDDDNGENQID
ncbi:hypothetical protein TRFO_22211 [Tritrichomonas foetus]|uniref:E2F/DP family winged-helix DNA-binding domain-containing protein n=1 Tax=Tritrichomonas foetus TaxID=1144522 RepID=A0A1J4KGW0_9EUKA|nr:hypothetical protein TRFO_22211 [Tritrichomonas foetus]|eukprot:OHT09044.1 hypothetical protein TRFO_22211 [Tritrichomonas foetus]